MQSSSCQNWYFVWVFGYEDEEYLLGFWIRGCIAHPANVGTLFQNFGYEDAELIRPI